MGDRLPAGVYEALLTRSMERLLPAAPELVRLGELDKGDSAAVLSNYVARVVRVVLESQPLVQDIGAQIRLCNLLIAHMAKLLERDRNTDDEAIDETGRQLIEVMVAGETPLAQRRPVARPFVRLDQNALFVAARQEPSLGSELIKEIESSDSVDLLCAFLVWSGVVRLREPIERLMARGGSMRVLTTTYTGTTESRALEELHRLGAQIKVSYDTGATRLHAKAWLFHRNTGFSTSYIGSSNLTHVALHDGLEWNVRLAQALSPELLDRFRATFETYWADNAFEPYEENVFREAIALERRRKEADLVPFDVKPYAFQREMLYQLEVERKRHNRWRNLVVAATGTGKTVLSAFDYKRLREEKGGNVSLLFVAHRREILNQSRLTFRNVLRDASFGELMVGGERPIEGRHVFASVQSLKASAVRSWPVDAYDVVIIDEFHHAKATSYKALLDHLKPRVLLGMTATPERSDGQDVRDWFGGHTAVELRLWDALEQGLLCPFQYFGVADDTDLSGLAWARGGYDSAQLDKIYTGNDARVSRVLHAVNEIVAAPRSMRALGFCVSIAHASYMARSFSKAGLASTAVSANTPPDERKAALVALADGRLNAIFSVDLFNEGLDIPAVDTVLFLRPTESATVFLQQLGRGLRRTPLKSGLIVLDFIGQQHRRFRFEPRFRALLGGNEKQLERQIRDGFPYLPAGCSITLDRQAERIIMRNLRNSVRQSKPEMVTALQQLGDISLGTFLQGTHFRLADIYAGSRPGWTVIRREAGFIQDMDPDEALLSRALARSLHVDDRLRTTTYLAALDGSRPPNTENLDHRASRIWNMLHFVLFGADLQQSTLRESLERLWRNPHIRSELAELLAVLAHHASHLDAAPDIDSAIPLTLHSRYNRNEILAAIGDSSSEKPTTWREGVWSAKHHKADILAVTLNKSEKRFSPSTRYRDYPVSPSRFHWESQSGTSVRSPTGQRYLNHLATGTKVLLFVRHDDLGDGIGASPFIFLGPVRYLSHQGERPIAITWELENEMPPDFFEEARAAV